MTTPQTAQTKIIKKPTYEELKQIFITRFKWTKEKAEHIAQTLSTQR